MTATSLPNSIIPLQHKICLIGVIFVLFQFFLQLSSGVIISSLMREMHLSALAVGMLSSAFYYVYTTLQIPVGMLFDRYSTRYLMTIAAFVCSLGCLFFACSHSFSQLMLNRLIMGSGAAFAFVGLSHLLRCYFPLNKFAFIIGLSETLGFLVTMVGILSLSLLINYYSWRTFLNSAAFLGFSISFFSWRLIPSVQPTNCSIKLQINQLVAIIKSLKLWVNGLFVGLGFTVITVFGALWAVPFIQVKLDCSLKQASLADAMIFFGAAVSCPLFGYLASYYPRRPLMIISYLTTASLFLILLFLPLTTIMSVAFLMFLIGITCGAYMLAYSIANELAPNGALSTCTGFTNTLAMLTAPLMQPLTGYLLDSNHIPTTTFYDIHAYQLALLTIPGGLLIATSFIFLLPEKATSDI
jgi:MFS family permease